MIRMTTFKNHEEWLKNRFEGLGGSEISAIVGLNPYMDNIALWEYKTRRKQPKDISDKLFVKYGVKAEPLLRELFKLDFPEYVVEYLENNSFRNSDYPWAQASLDGLLTDPEGRKGILEIKTTEIMNPICREKWNNKIPDNYYCQCLFYMAVVDTEFCVLKAQLKTAIDGIPYLQTKHYKIERSEVQGDIDYLMQEGEKFWQYVESKKQPPLVLPKI